MLHLLAANYNWHHTVTDKSEEIRVFATIFPMVRISKILSSAPNNSILTFRNIG